MLLFVRFRRRHDPRARVVVRGEGDVLDAGIPYLVANDVRGAVLIGVTSQRVVNQDLISSECVRTGLTRRDQIVGFFLPIYSDASVPVRRPFYQAVANDLYRVTGLVAVRCVGMFNGRLGTYVNVRYCANEDFRAATFDDSRCGAVDDAEAVGDDDQDVFRRFGELGIDKVGRVSVAVRAIGRVGQANNAR